MDAREFVSLVVEEAYKGAVRETVAVLESPPGRRPAADLAAASDWYRSIAADDRRIVDWIVASSAHAAVFRILAIVDGVTSAEYDQIDLVATLGDSQFMLNDRDEDMHDIFQSLVMDRDGRLSPFR